MDDYYDLGTYTRPITAATDAAREWTRRGLLWCYGYHHEEALACFERARESDPACPLSHWGTAYALGPNYNFTWELMDEAGRAEALAAAHDATGAAQEHAGAASPEERALIEALMARYPQRELPGDLAEMRRWNAAFADAMRGAHAACPDDLDLRAIYAEALVNITPWQMWDLVTGLPTEGARTKEAQRVLEDGFATDPRSWSHLGALHIYIHLMEMSPTPEAALRAADALRDLCPDAGHLVHMPSHIDVLCGDYAATIRANQRAVIADRKDYAATGGMNFYTAYRQHDYHFVIYGALFAGQMQPALDAARELVATTPPALLAIDSPPMADFLEAYLAFEPHVLIRFGRWHDLIAMDLPEDRALYCTCTATILYAKGVAHAALGQVAEAETMQQAFETARAAVPETRLLHTNTVADLLAVASEMLAGEIAYRKGAFDTAFAHLRAAVAREDALAYDEPWGWMQPSRHALGALLFEQGHIAKAETTYRQDLGLVADGAGTLPRACIHPDNVWALRGLLQCLEARQADGEAEPLRRRLAIVEARADAPVRASCFCARAAMV